MLNKNSLAVKKVRGQSEATMVTSNQNSDVKYGQEVEHFIKNPILLE